MAAQVEIQPPPRRWRRVSLVASLMAVGFAIAAVVVGSVGHRIGTDAFSDGCSMEDNHGTGPTMVNVAWWILAPLTFVTGLVAVICRGPIGARLAGAVSMVVVVVLAGWLMVTYWEYTCSY
jgi:hypothetical protein